jgi:hypothetical protein
MEMGAIRRILKRAKRWHLVGEDIRPLREPRQVGRALAHEEKAWLLKVANSKPEWQNARLAQPWRSIPQCAGANLKGFVGGTLIY